MEGFENNDGKEKRVRDEIFSKAVRAGKRTYFFDVKSTKRNDYYLTITESKKRFNQEGRHFFEKHKLFLYKEDFEKFAEGLNEAVEYIRLNQPPLSDEDEPLNNLTTRDEEDEKEDEFTNVEFEDLDNEPEK
ncbi:MAG: DUF3276 family protein [Bacteroidota bacterium]